MAPNSPACSFIHASMAGSRSTAPLNRSNSDLIVAPLFSFEIYGYVAYTTRPLACRARRNEKGYFLSNAVAFTDSERSSATRKPSGGRTDNFRVARHSGVIRLPHEAV